MLIQNTLHILHTALSCIGSYRSMQVVWLPGLFSNGSFDVLDLTEPVDLLESPGLVVTVLAASAETW
jgi:hypothetical protein